MAQLDVVALELPEALTLLAHFRSVSALQPIFSAIDPIAAHCDSCASSCSTTIRTARARTSGENLVGFGMAPILSRSGASGKPGAVHAGRDEMD